MTGEPLLELRLAIGAAVGMIAMVMYLAALMVAARIWGRFWRLRRANFVDTWRDYLVSEKPPLSARILSLHPDEVLHLVRVWNLEFERVRQWPERRARLTAIAIASGLTHAAPALAFRGRTRDERISGIQALGHLRAEEVYPRLEAYLSSPEDLIALAAWEAMLRIDEARTLRTHAAPLAEREGWPEHAVAHVVYEMSEKGKAALIGQAAALDCTPRIVSALEKTHHAGASQLIRHELETAPTFGLISRLIYAVQRAEHLELIELAVRRALRADPGGQPGWVADLQSMPHDWMAAQPEGNV